LGFFIQERSEELKNQSLGFSNDSDSRGGTGIIAQHQNSGVTTVRKEVRTQDQVSRTSCTISVIRRGRENNKERRKGTTFSGGRGRGGTRIMGFLFGVR